MHLPMDLGLWKTLAFTESLLLVSAIAEASNVCSNLLAFIGHGKLEDDDVILSPQS